MYIARLVIGQGRVGLGALLTDPSGLRVKDLLTRPEPCKIRVGLRYDLSDPKPAKKPAKTTHLS